MTALGEPTSDPVGVKLVVLATPPARAHCPNIGPRPRWLPPDRFHCPQDHYLQGTYGVTCDDYWGLFQRQEGRCGICRRPPWPGRRLVVDHDHDTGTIDGLCHFGCNRRLTTPQRRYLADPPGRALSLQVAPAKLRAIQEHDRAKRRREQARRVTRQQAQTGPPTDETFADRVQRALEQTTEQGGRHG